MSPPPAITNLPFLTNQPHYTTNHPKQSRPANYPHYTQQQKVIHLPQPHYFRMYSFATILALAAMGASAAPVAQKDAPDHYYEGYLEPYMTCTSDLPSLP